MDAEFQARITAKNNSNAAFAEMESGAARASRAVAALSASAGGMAERLGALPFEKGSEALRDFGRYAIASIAPILGVDAAIVGVKGALEKFSDIAHEAKAAGIDPEFFQGLAYQAGKFDIGVGDIATSLETFNKNSGQASAGIGRMQSQLKALDPELLKQIDLAGSQEERIKLVADAIEHQTSASKAAAIATAAFGSSGTRLVEVLRSGSSGIAETAEEARKMGLIVSDSLIDKADEMSTQFKIASEVLDLQFKSILVELAPLLTGTAEAISGIVKAVGDLSHAVMNSPGVQDLFAQTAPLGQRSGTIIGAQIADKQASLFQLRSGEASGQYGSSYFSNNGGPQLEAEVAQLQDELSRRDDPKRFDVAGEFGALNGPQYSSVKALKAGLNPYGSTGGVPFDPAAAAEAAKKLADVNKQLDLEYDNLGKTNEQQEIDNELSRAGVTADSLAGQSIKAKVEAIYTEQQALAELNDVYGAAKDTFMELFDTQRQNLANGEDWWQSWADAGKQAISDLLGKAEDALLSNAFNELWFGNGSQSSGAPSGGIGSLVGSVLSSLLGGAGGGIGREVGGLAIYGDGTNFAPGGLAIVGDRGPELVKLPAGSQVIPSNRIPPPDTASMSVSVTSVINLPGGSQGTGITPAQLKTALDARDAEWRRLLPAMVADARRRGAKGT